MIRRFACHLVCILLCISLIPIGGYGNGFAAHTRTIKAHPYLKEVRFSPDGKMLATGCLDGILKLWDTSNWRLKHTLKASEKGLYSFAFSPDGKMLATAIDNAPVIIWDTSTGRKTRSVSLKSGQRTFLSVGFSANGKLLAAGDMTGDIFLWDTSTWKLADTLDYTNNANAAGTLSQVWELAFSPDGRLLAAAGGDGMSRVWDMKTLKPLEYGRTEGSVSVVFSHNSRYLAVVCGVGPDAIWDVEAAKILTTVAGDPQLNYAVDFSPDGQLLACGGGAGARLWTTKSWRQTRRYVTSDWVHTLDWVDTLRFSPNGHTLAIGTDAGKLIIWNLR